MYNNNESIVAFNSRVRSNEKSLVSFIHKMAVNKRFATERPNTHSFFLSLAQYHAVRGKLTDKQKVAINSTIDKYAPYFVTLNERVVESDASTPDERSDSMNDSEYAESLRYAAADAQ